jgi:integrase
VRHHLGGRQSDGGLLDHDAMAWLQGEHVISVEELVGLGHGANARARCATVMPARLSRQSLFGGAGLEHPCGSVTPLNKSVTVQIVGRAVSLENLRLREPASTAVNVTVGKRSREYLTDREVERLIDAAKLNRSGHRDATAILVAYRHGLRASELVTLRWDDIDLATGRLHVRRAKSGDASVHPISARESRALRKLLREAPRSPYVFISERLAPLSVAGYQRMVARAGVAAKFTFLVHSHMLRHACGFKLANDGHDTRAIQAYLGHRSIMSTVRYTALTPNRFKNFWKD